MRLSCTKHPNHSQAAACTTLPDVWGNLTELCSTSRWTHVVPVYEGFAVNTFGIVHLKRGPKNMFVEPDDRLSLSCTGQ